MSDEVSDRSLADHQRIFDRIWTQLPAQQNRTSSSWWWFILFPEGDEGYGPEQLMFSIASRAGNDIRVNDIPMAGLDLDRTIQDGVDEFGAISVGWYGNDEAVQEGLVNQPATARLSNGSISAWADGEATASDSEAAASNSENGLKRGGEIRASADRELGLEAHFIGEKGEAEFEAWGELDGRVGSPVQAMDTDTIAGGMDLVAWRRMQFEGEFDLPNGPEHLEGICYFQRVCLNLPLFPWKWIWAFFPDGTAFSAFVPFLGPQLLRQGYDFFDSERLERSTIPIQESGLWDSATGDQLVEFDTASVRPVFDDGPHPHFEVEVSDGNGNHVAFRATSYGHARNYIDRPLFGGLTESHWSYNEYLFRMENLKGEIEGKQINRETMGQGFGTLEYACGLGL